jgi:energy-coupling factor transporter transmembrane protein EcfT
MNQKKNIELSDIFIIIGVLMFIVLLIIINNFNKKNINLENQFLTQNNTVEAHELIRTVNLNQEYLTKVYNLNDQQKINFLIYEHYKSKNTNNMILTAILISFLITIFISSGMAILNSVKKKQKKRG